MTTIEKYIKDNADKGIIDFIICAEVIDGKSTFYIHPFNKNGQTVNFCAEGNILTTTCETE